MQILKTVFMKHCAPTNMVVFKDHNSGNIFSEFCQYIFLNSGKIFVLLDFLVTVKAAPHECVIRTGQP